MSKTRRFFGRARELAAIREATTRHQESRELRINVLEDVDAFCVAQTRRIKASWNKTKTARTLADTSFVRPETRMLCPAGDEMDVERRR